MGLLFHSSEQTSELDFSTYLLEAEGNRGQLQLKTNLQWGSSPTPYKPRLSFLIFNVGQTFSTDVNASEPVFRSNYF